ncbi:DUF2721 domain-containing protein [Sphingomonas flavalba]|uniref:DUF2721 domain-containing protein n=1 Tax=Sphingomonas flavalba TaxID=2559804 RepID=UPI0039E1C5CF
MYSLPAISNIAQTIQLAIAPVFLLAGVGAFLNVLTGRLSRVVDRARWLEERHAVAEGEERRRLVTELRRLDRRMTLSSISIWLCVACAIAVCVLVALLFITQLVNLPYRVAVAASFVIAMALLIAGLIAFLLEIRIARKSFRIREELLIQDYEEAARPNGAPHI